MRVGAPFEVAHDFFRKLTSAWWNTARAPSYDFWRLINKSLTKVARAVSASIELVDKESLRKDIKKLVRKTVEETLNTLLDEETSELGVSKLGGAIFQAGFAGGYVLRYRQDSFAN